MIRAVNRQQKEILKKVVDYKEGLILPIVFRNIVDGDGKSAHALIASGHIGEVPLHLNGQTYTAYRASERGRMVFEPSLKRFWYAVKADIRTIVVAAITAIVTILITNMLR